MKNNGSVTGKEIDFSSEQRLISTTTSKGVITYANEEFCQIAGFPLEELKGQAHNVVRHPDMPQQAFSDMWAKLNAKKSWMGLVKNRCKNGDHYWVDAYVTPILENGEITEIQSVRTKPDTGAVQRASDLYKKFGKTSSEETISGRFSFFQQALIASLTAIAALALGAIFLEDQESFMSLVFGVIVCFSGITTYRAGKVTSLANSTKSIVDSPLGQLTYFNRIDDLTQIQLAIKMKSAELTAATGRVMDTSENLRKTLHQSSIIGEETSKQLSQQQAETEQSATAMTEMSATVQEVSENTNAVSEAANSALESSMTGFDQVVDSTNSINELANVLTRVVESVGDLKDKSSSIATVTDVIGGIAEQTNLLALNAAIEAARAGDQGRGFAVVADEVRGLAQRTHESTQEIQEVISEIQTSILAAVSNISKAEESSQACVNLNNKVMSSFSDIRHQTDEIAKLSIQVATATEEQTHVANEISQSVVNISGLAREADEKGKQIVGNQVALQQQLDESLKLISKFASM